MNTAILQAAILPPNAGWGWILQGYALFKRQPFAMIFWSLTTSLLINLAAAIPLLGQVALVTLTPLLTFLTLCACRNLAFGVRMVPGLWLAPLKTPGATATQLRLGLAYMACTFVAALVAVLPFLSQLTELIQSGSEADYLLLSQAIMSGPLVVFGLLYIVLSALFWHAPALMGWHQLTLRRALFYSMVACWRNKWAIILYVASWATVFFGLYNLFSWLANIGIAASLLVWISMPIDILITALLYCSFYPIYSTIFQVDDQATFN